MQIVEGYRPGAVSAICGLHINYYAREWGLGLPFEVRVASECAQFLQRYDVACDRLWLAVRDGVIEGSMALDHDPAGTGHEGLHLRWFILSDVLRGSGAGNILMQKAVDFADLTSGGRMWLTTFRGLFAARALYEKFGFELVSETEGDSWGQTVHEQVWGRPGPLIS